jgi:putative flippase GtrA
MLSGMAFNYLTTGGYVFRDLTLKRLPKFIAFYLLVFTLNLQSINILSTWISNSILAQAIITPPLAVFSYLLLGRFVFTSADTHRR